ncbi:M48 family metalloprotease [Novosphingobium sp. 1949]|uniref:M48 family metalloprotease n=1 Tax=Novosphingobium organovorum TaxID=2930092 RepID=A0ABT0BF13_9SPHN|nr:M48 family metalloprotease [Novosphingobium organovorum]MCJ2183637.1 M48 family metalloprotease [Novosphingobium organovorum]
MSSLRLAAFLLSLLALLGWSASPVAAQSILRDAETESFLHDLAAPVVSAAGLQPANVDIVLVNDSSVNAFVAGGQAVYINSGLIEEADTAAQVQGVIAHELGHVVGGHAVFNPAGKAASHISILSLLLGAAAIAAGGGEAGMGVMMAGQQAAMGNFLAYTRSQEASADAAGATFLSKAGISGRGSLQFFQKLQNLEFRHGYSPQTGDEFYSTHPLTGDRIQTLQDTYEKDPAWTKPDDPAMQARFERIKGKLFGYIADPKLVLRTYPPSDTSVPARYARAYAYHRLSEFDEARAEVTALVAKNPDDPYFLEMQGQILLESGHPRDALAPLRRATHLTGNQPLIASLFAHALIATDDPQFHDEAREVLKAAVARDRENPFAWYQLGVIYAQDGDMPRAYLASAEQQVMAGNMAEALRSAQAAQVGLPQYSADWLRAQDIEMQARAAMERARK